MFHSGDKIGIVCCSNGLPSSAQTNILKLKNILEKLGLVPIFSSYLYARDSVFSGTAKERAQTLMEFYKNSQISAIFDISGGDIANEILPYLDFQVIADHPKLFWGYSDLTVILNAIYAKTGLPSVLYQVMNLISDHAEMQRRMFSDMVFCHNLSLYEFPYEFIQGSHMEGIVLGGNIRCFLKLAGTEFFPDPRGKLLFLEARSGKVPQMVAYLSQLKMLGAFDQIAGIVLGTFTQMEQDGIYPDIITLIQNYAGNLPIVKTQKVGHGTDSYGIIIGGYRNF